MKVIDPITLIALEILASAFSESLAWEECYSTRLAGNFTYSLN